MVTELSLHVPNRPGEFAKILKVLAEIKVNVLAFTIDAAGGSFGIIRLVCRPVEEAIDQLYKYAYSIKKEQVLAIPMPQEPGQLQPIVELLAKEGINIEYGYLTLRPGTNEAIVMLKPNKYEQAIEFLKKNGYNWLNEIPQE